MRQNGHFTLLLAGVPMILIGGCKSPGTRPKSGECTPAEAKRLLEHGKDYVYLDVRTEAEFVDGHVPGALNIPVFVRSEDGGMKPNDDFLHVVEANLAKDRPLLVGCRSGRRSRIAIDKMRQAGFTDMCNVVGGYGGKKDDTGEVVAPGWSMLEYPTEKGDGGARSYAALKAKAGG